MPKWMSTRFSIVTRGGNAKNSCPSAIDAAGYISREELYCEYDGHTYKPDPKEDLVHSEIAVSLGISLVETPGIT